MLSDQGASYIEAESKIVSLSQNFNKCWQRFSHYESSNSRPCPNLKRARITNAFLRTKQKENTARESEREEISFGERLWLSQHPSKPHGDRKLWKPVLACSLFVAGQAASLLLYSLVGRSVHPSHAAWVVGAAKWEFISAPAVSAQPRDHLIRQYLPTSLSTYLVAE